jgi:phosphoribosylaminoimidazole-succinocarboxamide synthase
LAKGEAQRQLSKEFVRQWLIENGFQGKEGQVVPTMDAAFVASVTDRYIELYENITGDKFVKSDTSQILARIERMWLNFLRIFKRQFISIWKPGHLDFRVFLCIPIS